MLAAIAGSRIAQGVLAAIFAFLVAAAYLKGRSDVENRYDKAREKQAKVEGAAIAGTLTRALAEAEREQGRKDRLRNLGDEARSAPDADEQCLGSDSVERLRRLREATTGSADSSD